jgi:hypothetical protein
MARRLFAPDDDEAQITNASVSWAPEEPAAEPAPPRLVALEEEVARAKAERDPGARLMNLAQLLHSRQDEFRQRWGEGEFKRIARGLKKKISKQPLQQGEEGPGWIEAGLENADVVVKLPTDAIDYATMPIGAGEYRTIQQEGTPMERVMAPVRDAFGIPPASGKGFADPYLLGRAVKAPLDLAAAYPGFGSAVGNVVGSGVNAALGAPGGENFTPQAQGLLQPMQTFVENTLALPSIAALAAGQDPNSMPGILARSEAYLSELSNRNLEQPLEAYVGATMMGHWGSSGRQPALAPMPAGRRMFGMRPEPAAPMAEPPVSPELAAIRQEMRLLPNEPVPPGEAAVAAGPVNIRPATEAPVSPELAAIRQEMRVLGPEEPAPAPPPSRAEIAADEAARKLESQPGAISFQDVDAMIEQAKQGEVKISERQIAPGKKRISISGGGAGRVRPVGRRSQRRQQGALIVPNAAAIQQAFSNLGRAIKGTGRKLFTKMQGPGPQPAPPPGAPGGPGSGVPFQIETLNAQLTPVLLPDVSGVGGALENMRRFADTYMKPAATDSWMQKTGLNQLGIEATRLRNVLADSMETFLFGNESGRQWLKERYREAGPDLWEAVAKTREGQSLTPAEQAAARQHAPIFKQMLEPATGFLDFVRGRNLFRNLGDKYWPYEWGTIGNIDSLVRDELGQARRSQSGPPRAWYEKEPKTAPEKRRTTDTRPVRNSVDVMWEYAQSVIDKIVRGQMIEKMTDLRAGLDERGRMMLDRYVESVVFKSPHVWDAGLQQWNLGDKLKAEPKPGDTFPLDGALGLDGAFEVVGKDYVSPTRGQTWKVRIGGKDWPQAFSGPQIAALRMGENMPGARPLSDSIIGRMNTFAAAKHIFGNARSFWRQMTGGQSRLVAETALRDYSYGHSQALKYWFNKLPADIMGELRESGVLEQESIVDGVDQRASMLRKTLASNVYIPDTQTKVAAFLAERNRLQRTDPNLTREQRMDRCTDFALRVSDAQLALVQAPAGGHPGFSALGLFEKSHLAQLRHVGNMAWDVFKNVKGRDIKGAAGAAGKLTKYGLTTAAVVKTMAALGHLNDDEMWGILWSELPFGERIAQVATKFGLPGAPKRRDDPVVSAAGLDVLISTVADLLSSGGEAAVDVVKGRSWGSGRDFMDEADRKIRNTFGVAMYRTGSDLARKFLGSEKVSEHATKSLSTAPSKPYKTEYQKDRTRERRRAQRESSSYW